MAQLFSKELKGADIALFGLGRSNLSVARYLIKHGANVKISDKRMSEKDVQIKLEGENIQNVTTFRYGDAVKCDFVFRTPGMRPDSTELQIGAPIADEYRLFFENKKGNVIGVTGSDGKTTTATITAEILKKSFASCGKNVYLGGNIGIPLTEFLDELTEGDVTVAEFSSFQLMSAAYSPEISAITNITENHLDWHKSMQEYIAAKCNIFKNNGAEKLVINCDTVGKIAVNNRNTSCKLRIIDENSGICCTDGVILKDGEYLIDSSEIILPGEHNLKNYMTAIALTEDFAGIDAVRATAREFRGVLHRMTEVYRAENAVFYDSSIDSTPSRTIATLKCLKKPLTVIVGGYDKNLNYSELAQYLANNTTNVVVTGASGDKILREIAKIDCFSANVIYEDDFDKAVIAAVKFGLKDGGNVILSPACASFDRFEDYRERGMHFAELVKYI